MMLQCKRCPGRVFVDPAGDGFVDFSCLSCGWLAIVDKGEEVAELLKRLKQPQKTPA